MADGGRRMAEKAFVTPSERSDEAVSPPTGGGLEVVVGFWVQFKPEILHYADAPLRMTPEASRRLPMADCGWRKEACHSEVRRADGVPQAKLRVRISGLNQNRDSSLTLRMTNDPFVRDDRPHVSRLTPHALRLPSYVLRLTLLKGGKPD